MCTEGLGLHCQVTPSLHNCQVRRDYWGVQHCRVQSAVCRCHRHDRLKLKRVHFSTKIFQDNHDIIYCILAVILPVPVSRCWGRSCPAPSWRLCTRPAPCTVRTPAPSPGASWPPCRLSTSHILNTRSCQIIIIS